MESGDSTGGLHRGHTLRGGVATHGGVSLILVIQVPQVPVKGARVGMVSAQAIGENRERPLEERPGQIAAPLGGAGPRDQVQCGCRLDAVRAGGSLIHPECGVCGRLRGSSVTLPQQQVCQAGECVGQQRVVGPQGHFVRPDSLTHQPGGFLVPPLTAAHLRHPEDEGGCGGMPLAELLTGGRVNSGEERAGLIQSSGALFQIR